MALFIVDDAHHRKTFQALGELVEGIPQTVQKHSAPGGLREAIGMMEATVIATAIRYPEWGQRIAQLAEQHAADKGEFETCMQMIVGFVPDRWRGSHD